MRPDLDNGNGEWDWLRDRVATDENLVLISGYARLPEKVSSHAQWEQIGVILVIDTSTDLIVAADATLVTNAARAFFRGVVEGRSIRTEVSAVITRLDTQYHGHTGPALVTALKRCLEHVGIHVVERDSNPGEGGNSV
ncbi:MAG: DUF3870 domain-containing protein [Solirubrobacterales bacterium]|nr:DUF3870 domain-containing protein [Solirubrobacterales bacterium]OJU95669.1 MAG: hypothetical protein BGO23_08660 [Solirubrobacterales bacterium 67-14]